MAEECAPNYEKLRIWQESISLSLEIYRITSKFPKHEIFGLMSQLRRAATSVPLNIAEGAGRGNKEFRHFLTISLGSCNETMTALCISKELKYLSDQEYSLLRTKYLDLIPQVRKLISNLSSKL